MSSQFTVSTSRTRRALHPAFPILLGLVSIAAGVIALAWPGITLAAAAALLGIGVLAVSVCTLVNSVAAEGDSAARVLFAVLGVFGIVAGLVALRHPGSALVLLVVVAGAWLTVSGVGRMGAVVEPGPGRGLQLLMGLIDVVLGITILSVPSIGLVTLALLFSLGLIAEGGALITGGWMSRRATAVDLDDRFVPAAGTQDTSSRSDVRDAVRTH